jgi:HlyD family secretion protein
MGVLAGVPLLAGCSHGPGTPASAAAPPPARTVGVVTATQGDVTRTISQPATIQGIEEATLYAKTAGYLKAIYVDKGDRVRAGQVLAVIESPELLHQQAQARAAFQQSEAATRGVVASRGRAQADVTQAGAAVERARADARQAGAVIARARAGQSGAEAQLPKFQAMIQEAEANVQQAVEQQAGAQADVARWQQHLKGAQAAQRASQAGLE